MAVDSIAAIILPVCARWRHYSTVLVMAPYSNSEKLVITPSKFDAMSSNLNAPLVEEYSFEAQPELLNVFQPASFGARWSFRSFIVVIQVNNRTRVVRWNDEFKGIDGRMISNELDGACPRLSVSSPLTCLHRAACAAFVVERRESAASSSVQRKNTHSAFRHKALFILASPSSFQHSLHSHSTFISVHPHLLVVLSSATADIFIQQPAHGSARHLPLRRPLP